MVEHLLGGSSTLETMRCTGDELRVEHPSLADGIEVPQATAVLNSFVENSQLWLSLSFQSRGEGGGRSERG